jgi:hypothetical protein
MVCLLKRFVVLVKGFGFHAIEILIVRVMLNSAPGALVKHTQKENKKTKLMLDR